MDANRYVRVSAAWVAAVFGPSAAMFAYYFSGPDCDGSEFYGCRWGIDGGEAVEALRPAVGKCMAPA